MTKRALLIGSQTYGLTGVNGDVALMAETFAARGFDVTVQVDEAATRAAILDAYEKLIAETPDGSGDPVVVYYSGHGGRTALDGWEGRQLEGARTHLRYIVPFDMAASTESDFRGLLAEELSALQARLTERTANVTTILDCCHSGTMSRDPSMTPKAVPRDFPIAGAVPLLDRLDALAADDGWDASNRLAVRVVACDPTQSAYERASVARRPARGADRAAGDRAPRRRRAPGELALARRPHPHAHLRDHSRAARRDRGTCGARAVLAGDAPLRGRRPGDEHGWGARHRAGRRVRGGDWRPRTVSSTRTRRRSRGRRSPTWSGDRARLAADPPLAGDAPGRTDGGARPHRVASSGTARRSRARRPAARAEGRGIAAAPRRGGARPPRSGGRHPSRSRPPPRSSATTRSPCWTGAAWR